ncbi:lipopolysaccharide heptosyltransferase I [Cellvibrio sp.]|uniref:lipopolysaccharide heptosyltransferase I n=1 Tax=Cellvibrio sp. TaxID=1965322 RepID=UPI003964875B
MENSPVPLRILLVKMSSMGDIFHTFPAISDLKAHHPEAIIDWVVEDGFKEIVDWHPAINKAIPISLRRWMKERGSKSWQEFRAWKRQLKSEHYDVVIDAQGLFKSAIISKCANAKEIRGFNSKSAREPIASLFYNKRYGVDKNQHAVERTRQLFAHAFGYTPAQHLNFGINQNFSHVIKNPRKLMFIIGTSWVTKLWSSFHWQKLTAIAIEEGFDVEIMWGSLEERSIADSIIAVCPKATRPQQRMSITTIAENLVEAAGVIGLDTGFSHLAGALETPTVALYGATSPIKVGLIGKHTSNLQLEQVLSCMPCHKRQCKWLPENSHETPPCMNGIKPFNVWNTLIAKMN